MFSANNCRPNQKIEKRAFASTNLSIALSKDSNCLDREQKNGKNEQIGFSSRCHISLWYCTLPTVDLRYTFGVGCSIFKRIQCKIFDKCKMFKLYKNTISEKAKKEGSSPCKSCSTCITKLFGKYENITCHPHLVQIKIQIQIRIAFITIYTKKHLPPAVRVPHWKLKTLKITKILL